MRKKTLAWWMDDEEENLPFSRIMLNLQPTHKVLPLLHPTAHNLHRALKCVQTTTHYKCRQQREFMARGENFHFKDSLTCG